MARKKPDKLAREVSMALAAGMSYGKWKAMQPHVTAEKEPPENYIICPQCGKRFRKRNGKKFCDDDCRQAAYVDKQREINRKYARDYRIRKGLKQ